MPDRHTTLSLLLPAALAVGLGASACSRGGAPDRMEYTDAAVIDQSRSMTGGDDMVTPPDLTVRDLAPPADLLTGPTAAECFERWRMYGGSCPGPVITQAWASATGCSSGNHPGLFIEGMNFQLEMRNMGIADYGPQARESHDQKHWNELTTTRLCVTMNLTYAMSFPGKPLSVRNPDGKISNSVIIQRR